MTLRLPLPVEFEASQPSSRYGASSIRGAILRGDGGRGAGPQMTGSDAASFCCHALRPPAGCGILARWRPRRAGLSRRRRRSTFGGRRSLGCARRAGSGGERSSCFVQRCPRVPRGSQRAGRAPLDGRTGRDRSHLSPPASRAAVSVRPQPWRSGVPVTGIRRGTLA
jgi:hypothetical protein